MRMSGQTNHLIWLLVDPGRVKTMAKEINAILALYKPTTMFQLRSFIEAVNSHRDQR